LGCAAFCIEGTAAFCSAVAEHEVVSFFNSTVSTSLSEKSPAESDSGFEIWDVVLVLQARLELK
jgi:hypothetical protein